MKELYILLLLSISTGYTVVSQTFSDLASTTPNKISFSNHSNITHSKNDMASDKETKQYEYNHHRISHEVEDDKQQNLIEQKANFLVDEALHSFRKKIVLPSLIKQPGAMCYRSAFKKLKHIPDSLFTLKKTTFIIENAYYEERESYAEFKNTIKQTGNFLKEKMHELGYDQSSNLAKNFILFQFFSDTLEIKSKKLQHLPLTYDFDDYSGKDDWTKMFVKKLLETGKGQCNSLPKLYMILAEEIQAEASLALSPNHSYIKFQDDQKRKWYNVELTNGMFTTDAFILQSGYIKAEALQNKIYMHPLSKKELSSQQFLNLALGYIHKYGYDEFVNEIISYALELNPGNINAHLIKSNYNAFKLKYTLDLLGITRENFSEIRHHSFAVDLYRDVVDQYKLIDDLGYQKMPEEAYRKWLSSVKKQEGQQDNKYLKSTFKSSILIKQ